MSKVKKIVKKAAPVLLPAIGTLLFPGIGTAIGSALGAGAAAAPMIGGSVLGGIGGLASGGGIKSALLGAATGGLGAGGSAALVGRAGLTGMGAKIASGALTGAAAGGATGGDVKSALTGAALGGIAGGLGGATGGTLSQGAQELASGGSLFGPSLSSGAQQLASGGALLGSGASGLGSLTQAAGSTGLASGGGASALTGGGSTGNMLGQVLKTGAGLYSQAANEETNEEISQLLEQAQGRAISELSPYAGAGRQALGELQGGFNPQDLQNDPGYQFRLQEGESALGRSLAAQGMSQSGAAMKAAQRYGQGLADQTYNDAYRRWLATNQPMASMGYGAASGIGDLYGDIGGINALTRSASQRSQDELLANLIGGGSSLGNILGGRGLFG